MNRWFNCRIVLAVVVVGLAMRADSVLACAACYGKSDSPLAQGMNWGIFSLLVMVVCVLSGIASFFIFLAKKSAAVSAAGAAQGGLVSATPKA